MRNPQTWMWADALDALARTERLHHQLFQLSTAQPRQACWEPPVDVLETEHEVLIMAAVPGVAADQINAVIDGAVLIIAGERTHPDALKTAKIHRMELPQGRFERRVPLPRGRYDQVSRQLINGCLVISLRKIG